MMGRRTVALLCVLLLHAWGVYFLLHLRPRVVVPHDAGAFASEPITILFPLPVPESDSPGASEAPKPPQSAPLPAASTPAASAGASGAITAPEFVDWPLEGKLAAARVLAREAEAERLAKMFAGPDGTWASLTKRQRSRLDKFRWKPGIDGLEYDADGNQIFHISEGCVIVNSSFIACALGKPKVHGDMFENMREYFDELRLPHTDEGNGTEPESLRPPY